MGFNSGFKGLHAITTYDASGSTAYEEPMVRTVQRGFHFKITKTPVSTHLVRGVHKLGR